MNVFLNIKNKKIWQTEEELIELLKKYNGNKFEHVLLKEINDNDLLSKDVVKVLFKTNFKGYSNIEKNVNVFNFMGTESKMDVLNRYKNYTEIKEYIKKKCFLSNGVVNERFVYEIVESFLNPISYLEEIGLNLSEVFKNDMFRYVINKLDLKNRKETSKLIINKIKSFSRDQDLFDFIIDCNILDSFSEEDVKYFLSQYKQNWINDNDFILRGINTTELYKIILVKDLNDQQLNNQDLINCLISYNKEIFKNLPNEYKEKYIEKAIISNSIINNEKDFVVKVINKIECENDFKKAINYLNANPSLVNFFSKEYIEKLIDHSEALQSKMQIFRVAEDDIKYVLGKSISFCEDIVHHSVYVKYIDTKIFELLEDSGGIIKEISNTLNRNNDSSTEFKELSSILPKEINANKKIMKNLIDENIANISYLNEKLWLSKSFFNYIIEKLAENNIKSSQIFNVAPEWFNKWIVLNDCVDKDFRYIKNFLNKYWLDIELDKKSNMNIKNKI